jgi:hypothetical protein
MTGGYVVSAQTGNGRDISGVGCNRRKALAQMVQAHRNNQHHA